jgi:hypothetical protein
MVLGGGCEAVVSVDVVIPAYHRTPELVGMSVKCIEAAKQTTNIPYRTIIVETGTDHLREFADLHLFEARRTSPTKSMNRAFALCDADLTVLLTNDVFVKDGWLEALMKPFDMFDDCGLSTVASTQFGHQREDKIVEGNWFSLAMWRTNGRVFDERFDGVWDDTDLIMSNYAKGLKFYRNFNCVVDHLVGATAYHTEGHNDRFEEGKRRFIDKWIGWQSDPYFRELAGI